MINWIKKIVLICSAFVAFSGTVTIENTYLKKSHSVQTEDSKNKEKLINLIRQIEAYWVLDEYLTSKKYPTPSRPSDSSRLVKTLKELDCTPKELLLLRKFAEKMVEGSIQIHVTFSDGSIDKETQEIADRFLKATRLLHLADMHAFPFDPQVHTMEWIKAENSRRGILDSDHTV